MKVYRIISRYKRGQNYNDDEVIYEFKKYKEAKRCFDNIITYDLEDELVLSEYDSDDDYSSSIELETKQFPKGDEKWIIT